ncbi:hypothetical protein [Chryseobacterium sp. Hurlbut01]|uniref:hypothetical protein n=1 Tax=Chryseobacterium sp. Hurlbut01 TaxID=1681828 RepID=UPI00067BF576|nr:hypothetical protein [Chryseobacterium sp. Hurlbut01]KNB60979.1 hypothetical protein AC804_17705 [Chryseobacterium sp. Hurlbut01]
MKRKKLTDQYVLLRDDLINYLNEYLLPLLRGNNFSNRNIFVLFYEDIFNKENLILTKVDSINEDSGVMLEFEYFDGNQSEEIDLRECHLITLMQLVEYLEPLTE